MLISGGTSRFGRKKAAEPGFDRNGSDRQWEQRKCKKEMIRVLKTADDTIEIDATGRRNGRGAYLCPSMDCWKKAVKSKGLERSLKMAIPKEVYEALEKEMEQFGES